MSASEDAMWMLLIGIAIVVACIGLVVGFGGTP